MHLLEKALTIVLEAHAGQVDKADRPYILHPIRLMTKMKTDQERIAALLHDVLEDSHYTAEMLMEEGFSKETVTIIESLTNRENESYNDFIYRVARNRTAARIKIEDIKDNMDISRLDSVGQKDLDRLVKYHKALKFLQNI